jgi:hypothetical protein
MWKWGVTYRETLSSHLLVRWWHKWQIDIKDAERVEFWKGGTATGSFTKGNEPLQAGLGTLNTVLGRSRPT